MYTHTKSLLHRYFNSEFFNVDGIFTTKYKYTYTIIHKYIYIYMCVYILCMTGSVQVCCAGWMSWTRSTPCLVLNPVHPPSVSVNGLYTPEIYSKHNIAWKEPISKPIQRTTSTKRVLQRFASRSGQICKLGTTFSTSLLQEILEELVLYNILNRTPGRTITIHFNILSNYNSNNIH